MHPRVVTAERASEPVARTLAGAPMIAQLLPTDVGLAIVALALLLLLIGLTGIVVEVAWFVRDWLERR